MALINSQQTIFDVANQVKILTFFVKWPLPMGSLYKYPLPIACLPTECIYSLENLELMKMVVNAFLGILYTSC